MLKRREILNSIGACLGVVSAWIILPGTANSHAIAVTYFPNHLDKKTAIRRWSEASEYSTKHLKGYGAFYGGSRDLSAIIDFVTEYHAVRNEFPLGQHIVTRYSRGMTPVGTRNFIVSFASDWSDNDEPVGFFDA